MVPFTMRLLHAELPQYTGLPHQSLDRLYSLQAVCRQIITNLKNGLTEDGSEMEMTDENRQGMVPLRVHLPQITILISHDQLPSGIVAQ